MGISTALQQAFAGCGCEVDFSNHTRQLYATDASLYRVEPAGVTFPRTAAQAAAVVRLAADANLPVIPRGAGSGLTGGALGEGLIIDFARHNRQIRELNLEKRTVCVGAGVLLDQLNNFLQPRGLQFGPDVATSSRATLGGMIANNSSGARVPAYGCTGSHVAALELVLASGQIVDTGRQHDALNQLRQVIQHLLAAHRDEIGRRLPAGLLKRWPGYGLDRCLHEPNKTLIHLLAGSEGTLAGIFSAELNLVPIPPEKGLAIVFFASVAEAMQATVALLDLKPAAIEHVDRILFDQTKGQLNFKAARDLLELDSQPGEAFLIVEFYADVRDRLATVVSRNLGLRTKVVSTPAEMNLIWGLRKAGLSLLTGCPGPAKPTTCIEDVAVRPEQLPVYVAELQSLLHPRGIQACFYGHAASGLLHVRPVLDLHTAAGVRNLRFIADEVSALVRQFKGSLAAEHGVGIARTEYLPAHLGERLLELSKEIKRTFDPRNIFNPGKIISTGRFKIDADLRQGEGYELRLPFEPRLAFAPRDGSFIANLEQCNGCGGCLKQAPTMCPTFIATGEEIMSTRGRANTIRAALEGRFPGADWLGAPELEVALSTCLSCKACATECPSNVNLPLLKAELLHARHDRHGLSLRARVIGAVDWLGKAGCRAPALANACLEAKPIRWLLQKMLGFSSRRPLPRYTNERFDHWFARREKPIYAPRGRAILWDDTFVRYHDPHIGRAAVAVLEAAGFAVTLLQDRVCCGRPAFSQGDVEETFRLGRHNLELLAHQEPEVPVIFLEPSCWAMFVDDYLQLQLPGAPAISRRSFLFEQFIGELLVRTPQALRFRSTAGTVKALLQAHCQAKALLNPAFMARLAQRVPNSTVTLLDTGCCGMAGAFGALESKYDLSVKIAAPLIQEIQRQSPGTIVLASGASCRHQINHLTSARPQHLAEWLAAALEK